MLKSVLVALGLSSKILNHVVRCFSTLCVVEEKMRNALSLNVPIEIQIGTGNNWLEAH